MSDKTGNTSNVDIYIIEMFVITQSKLYTLYSGWYKENNKYDSKWVSLWLRDKHVHGGTLAIKYFKKMVTLNQKTVKS